MLLVICLTFGFTTGLYLFLAWLACRRISSHLQGNAAAARAVAEHILLPLFGRKDPQLPESQEDESLLEEPIAKDKSNRV